MASSARASKPGESKRPAPASVEEALRNAAHHARSAVAESIAAARSLLDAASLVATGSAAQRSPALASLARLLDELEQQVASPSPGYARSRDGERVGEPLARALSEALDAEIARWEARAERDADARAVLRAFLGLREVLWELGVRPSRAESEAPRDTHRPRPTPAASRQKTGNSDVTPAQADATHPESVPRVQRMHVRG